MKNISKYMKHSNKLGAGAKKRARLGAKNKIHVVMAEYKRGTLHSGSGAIVKSRAQAVAIAMSESRKHGHKRKRK